MDALVEPNFFGVLPDERELARRLEAAIAQARYDEDLLDRIRMFGLEHMFLIGVRILTGTVTAAQAGEAFARLADIVIREVYRAVKENFAQQHGHLSKATKRGRGARQAWRQRNDGELRSRPDPDL